MFVCQVYMTLMKSIHSTIQGLAEHRSIGYRARETIHTIKSSLYQPTRSRYQGFAIFATSILNIGLSIPCSSTYPFSSTTISF
jgi:hypothetical protein